MAKEVFISYAEEDKTAADAVVKRLEAAGAQCWIAPRDIPPGAEWVTSIMKGIGAARIMVLIYSKHANHSGYIEREVGRAVEKKTYLIPLRLDKTPPTEKLEFFISAYQWLDAFPPPIDPYLDQLVQTVQAVLKNSAHLDEPAPKPQNNIPPLPVESDIPPPVPAAPQVILGMPTHVHQVPVQSAQGPKNGMLIKVPLTVQNAKGRSLQLVTRFSYANGPLLYANPQEPFYRDVTGLVATGTPRALVASNSEPASEQLMSIPYYALNFVWTNCYASYNLALSVSAYLDDQLVAQTPPVFFGFRW
jgi:hypothetical protein